MTFSRLAVQRPVLTWMLMFALILPGVMAYKEMGVGLLPETDLPQVVIEIQWAGAPPESLEVDVLDPIERALNTLQGVQNMRSIAGRGVAQVQIDFGLDKSIDVAAQEVEAELLRLRTTLPVSLKFAVRKFSTSAGALLWIAASSEQMTPHQLMTYVRDHLSGRLSRIEGVADVLLDGYREPGLNILPRPADLRRHQVGLEDIVRAVQGSHRSNTGGQIQREDRDLNLQLWTELSDVKDFEQLEIVRPDGRTLRLGQVARVELGLGPVRRLSRANGVTSVGLGVRKKSSAQAVAVARAVKKELPKIREGLPAGFVLDLNFDSTKFVEESIEELIFTLILAALLTALICWIFLGSWSANLNVILAIPTSILGSLAVLNLLGFTLNVMTLLALSLAIGLVVDDAIMVLENIVRRREEGESLRDAAIRGAEQISWAAVAATLAIVAVFLPVAYSQGVVGAFLFQFGLTVSIAVGLSLIEALTLTPMRCSQFLNFSARRHLLVKAMDRLIHSAREVYLRVLKGVLKYRRLTLCASFGLFVASLVFVDVLKKEFMPAQDKGFVVIQLEAPVGSSLHFTDRQVRRVEKILDADLDVEKYIAAVGGFQGEGSQAASIFVSFRAPKERTVDKALGRVRTDQEVIASLRHSLKAVESLKVFFQDPLLAGVGGSKGFDIEFFLQGEDWKLLTEQADQFVRQMKASGLMVDVGADHWPARVERQIVPQRKKAREEGLHVSQMAELFQIVVGAPVIGRYNRSGHREEIRIGLAPGRIQTEQEVLDFQLRNRRGELVPLSRVAAMEQQAQAQRITRINGQRSIHLFANLADDVGQNQALTWLRQTADKSLSPGVSLQFSGAAAQLEESFLQLIFALLLGAIVAYMILAAQYNSWLDPLTIFLSLPFSLSGAFLGLWVTGLSLNIFSLIGLILLMGIVKKNAILLVEFTRQVQRQSLDVHQALLQACPQRLRPILMTAVSTVAAALPAALVLGPGAELRQPMAVAVIGGVAVSTLLTLVVVPCLFSLLDPLQKRSKLQAQPIEPAES